MRSFDQPARAERKFWIYILIAALILAAGLIFGPAQAATFVKG